MCLARNRDLPSKQHKAISAKNQMRTILHQNSAYIYLHALIQRIRPPQSNPNMLCISGNNQNVTGNGIACAIPIHRINSFRFNQELAMHYDHHAGRCVSHQRRHLS